MKKRGMFFSGDALIALFVILLVAVVVYPLSEYTRTKNTAHEDLITTLSTLKIGEVDNSYVASLISNGLVNDMEKSVLEQIGEFYATNVSLARGLAESVLSDLDIDQNVGIWFGNNLIASLNKTSFENASNVDTRREFISGIENSSSATGFSSRAYLSNAMQTKYYYFGGYVGEGNITSLIRYSGEINSAEVELTVNNNFGIYVNGDKIGDYAKSNSDFEPVRYNISKDYFKSDFDNLVEFKDNNLHISGGFIKITYSANATVSDKEKYSFPGIDGMVNLYDGFYSSGEIQNMNIFLHVESEDVPLFLSIGNVTIFNRATVGEETINIGNAELSSKLDYGAISGKTVPIRMGLENVSYIGISQNIDVFSVTDLSGSMADCAQYLPPYICHYNCWFGGSKTCQVGSPSLCTGNVCGGQCFFPNGHYLDCNKTKLDLAKDANNVFVDIMLNSSGNRVGLVGYKEIVYSNDVHSLSNNVASLKSKISSWLSGGNTCICCGINKAVSELTANSTSDKFKSMVVMSDGQANVRCSQQGTGSATQDAVQAACNAYNNYNITVNTIGFGSDADENTLQAIASCGGGSYFYSSADELSEIYKQVADTIVANYFEQTVGVIGNLHTKLFADSYIEFSRNQSALPYGLVMTSEQKFYDAYSCNFSLPLDGTPVETRVISYSGSRWTDNVRINSNNIYKLSDYGTNYISLGDPYMIYIPNSFVNAGVNNVRVTTGVSPLNSSQGSSSNKVIYTFVRNATSYSPIVASAGGCNWHIDFEDDGTVLIAIPDSYSGTDECYFDTLHSIGEIANENDALQLAVLKLLKELDFNSNGRVDVPFKEQELKITSKEVIGIPFTWATEVEARTWW